VTYAYYSSQAYTHHREASRCRRNQSAGFTPPPIAATSAPRRSEGHPCNRARGTRKPLLCKGFSVEWVTGIEPAWAALEGLRDTFPIERGYCDYVRVGVAVAD
jgi:hypothetical protein